MVDSESKKRTLSETESVEDNTKRPRQAGTSSTWTDHSAMNLTTEQKERLEKAKAYARKMKSELTKTSTAMSPISTNNATTNITTNTTGTSTTSKPPNKNSTLTTHAILSATNPHIHSGVDIRTLSVLARIYVGSINFELNETHVRAVFDQFGIIKSISMSLDPVSMRHKGFCFIEYETPEGASLALETMNGADLGGRALKVGRPNNYATAASSGGVPIPPKSRIYVANVNEMITEENLQTIFEAFGTIKKCILLPDYLTRKHKGYGFIEFEDETAASTAMESMRNFEIAGQMLRVSKSIIGGPLTDGMKILDSMPPPAVIAATLAATAENSNSNNNGYNIPNNTSTGPGMLARPGTTTPSTSTTTTTTTTTPATETTTGAAAATDDSDDVMVKVNANIQNLGIQKKLDLFQQQQQLRRQHHQNHPHNPHFHQQHRLQHPQFQNQRPPPDPTALMRAANLAREQEKAANAADSVAKEEDMHVNSSQRFAIMQKLAASREQLSTHMLVQNAVPAGEVDESLNQEFSDECSKFGKVRKVSITTGNDDSCDVRDQPGWQPGDGDVKIFVEFETSGDADKARQVLDGRWFGGRKLKAQVIYISDLDKHGIH